jgi:hypothetical protein
MNIIFSLSAAPNINSVAKAFFMLEISLYISCLFRYAVESAEVVDSNPTRSISYYEETTVLN